MIKSFRFLPQIILFAITFSFYTSYADSIPTDTTPTVIFGSHIDYKNTLLKIETISDYISGTVEIIGSDSVDENGNFRIEIETAHTKQISINLGKTEGLMYIEPHKEYEIVLPPFEPLSMAEIVNPYFKPAQINIGIKNIDTLGLNYQIMVFDNAYYKMLERFYYTIFKEPKRSMVDSLINSIEIQFTEIKNPFFTDYTKYKYAWVKYVSYMRDYRYIIRDYFNSEPIAYYNNAYMDLFNQLFANYLSFYMGTSEGARLYSDIAYAKSPEFIKETFSNNMVLTNNNIQELVLLKGLKDAFYSNDFPSQSLSITLDSIELTSKVPEHIACAKNIKNKVFKNAIGQSVPYFELPDSHGTIRRPKDFLANYVYLNFCSVESFPSQQDLELLKVLHEKHKQEFRIISISVDKDFEVAKEYFNTHGYEWMLLSCNENMDLISDFNVRVFPTYYLINPEGNFQMSPAKSPSENFEWAFFKLLQEKKAGELRKNNEK